jgi:tetratricopeptide (TPR) repeat protein
MTHSGKSLPQQQIEFLENSRTLYLAIAGGWPPNVRDKKELDEVRTLIIKDIESAKLFIEENPEIIEGREIYADLLRMAHNVDVPGAAQKSEAVLKEILKNNPQSYPATMSLASLYITSNTELAPKAEEYFHRALKLRPNSSDPAIYQGLGFASLHQNRIDLAIESFQKYLCLVPTDANISEFVSKLIAGKKPVQVKESVAEKSSKSWWKLW